MIAVRLPDGTVRDTVAARLRRDGEDTGMATLSAPSSVFSNITWLRLSPAEAGAAADDMAVSQLCAMGFAAAPSRQALAAAGGDLERATAILLDPVATAATAAAAAAATGAFPYNP